MVYIQVLYLLLLPPPRPIHPLSSSSRRQTILYGLHTHTRTYAHTHTHEPRQGLEREGGLIGNSHPILEKPTHPPTHHFGPPRPTTTPTVSLMIQRPRRFWQNERTPVASHSYYYYSLPPSPSSFSLLAPRAVVVKEGRTNPLTWALFAPPRTFFLFFVLLGTLLPKWSGIGLGSRAHR